MIIDGFCVMIILAKNIYFGRGMQRYHLYIVFLLLLITFSCAKVHDEQDPVIEFLYPAFESVHNSQSLEVKFHVRDDLNLAHVRLSLVNTDHVSVMPPVWFYPKTKDTVIAHLFTLPANIQKGEYRLQVWASDGYNEKFKYLHIHIDPAETADFHLYYISQTGKGSQLWRIPPALDLPSIITELSVTVEQLIMGANNNLLYVLSAKPSRVQALSVHNGERVWEQTAGMPASEFTHMYLEDNHLLIGDANGLLSMYNASNGNGLLTSPMSPDTIPRLLYFDQDYIYTAQEIISGGKYQMSLYFRPTAAFYKRFQLPGPVFGIFPYADDALLLLVMTDSQLLSLFTWHKQDETFSLLSSFETAPPERVVQDGADHLLVFTKNGLLRLQTKTGQYSVILSGDHVSDAVRHPLTDELFISRGAHISSSTSDHEASARVRHLEFGPAN